MVDIKLISKEESNALLHLNEGHFADLKGKALSPAKFTKAVSAFANSAGGEIYIGIEELEGVDGKERVWDGFDDPEAGNPFFQVIHEIDPLSKNFSLQFLKSEGEKGFVLHVTVSKTQEIITATDGKIYIRSNASSLPVKDDALERLRYDKGVQTYENELLSIDSKEITNSETVIEFLIETIPTGEPDEWLTKQFVLQNDRPTVAGTLLFSDNPQAILPKRSAVKILRYQTKADAERDFLAFDPETIEGPLYHLIYNTVDRVKQIIEGIEKMGEKGMNGSHTLRKPCTNW